VVKAVVRTGTIDRRDRFGYSDPNVPCGQQRVARWQFIDANPSGAFKPTGPTSPQRMFGWVPQNVPAGSPRTGSRDNCP
jgi:hypothetical protein